MFDSVNKQFVFSGANDAGNFATSYIKTALFPVMGSGQSGYTVAWWMQMNSAVRPALHPPISPILSQRLPGSIHHQTVKAEYFKMVDNIGGFQVGAKLGSGYWRADHTPIFHFIS